MKAFVWVVVLAGVTLASASAQSAEPVNTAPTYRSMKDVKGELRFIRDIWDGDGIVIVGKLELPAHAKVSSRIPIYQDSSYCTALYEGRRLVFFAHGYDPLEITNYVQIATNVYDAGSQQFIKAAPENTRTLCGSVVTASTGKEPTRINCALQIRNEAYLWQDHGYRAGATITVNADSTKLDSGMPFFFRGLSRLPYRLVLTAPGHIKKEIELDQARDGAIDLGEIALDPALSYRIRYRERVRQNGGKWIGGDTVKSSMLLCDGRNEFSFTKQRDGLGNSLKLRMHPAKNNVTASFFYHQRNSFYDLGQCSADDLPSWATVDTSHLKGDSGALLKDGHAYYFTIDEINGTSIQMVFHVEKE